MTRQLWVSQSHLKNTSIHPCLPIIASRAFKSSFSIKSIKEELSWVIYFILFPDAVHLKGPHWSPGAYELTDGAFQIAHHEHQLLGLRAGQLLGGPLCNTSNTGE